MEFEARNCFGLEACAWKFCVLKLFRINSFLVETGILRNYFQLFSGQDLTMELLRSFALDVRIHLGESRG